MADIDRRISALTPAAHAAALRRLSTRAASSTIIPTTASASVLSHLRSSGVHILPGLSPSELSLIEAAFSFSFPPDLRALISLGLPSGPGFPDWRSPSNLRPLLHLPTRFALRSAPLLLPVFNQCYLPSLPALAGNPLFVFDDSRVSICALDLSDFFLSNFSPFPLDSRSLDLAARTPRWIEFWTEAAMARPAWVGKYLDRIGGMLKEGGWREKDVAEMVEVAASGFFDCDAAVDGKTVLYACGDSLRRGGWSSEEISDALGMDFW